MIRFLASALTLAFLPLILWQSLSDEPTPSWHALCGLCLTGATWALVFHLATH